MVIEAGARSRAVRGWRRLRNEAPYNPWWAQRLVMRSRAAVRVIVAGRQTGKTVVASRIVVKVACQRARSQSCLLMPNKKSTAQPVRLLRAALEAALGPEQGRWSWKAQDAKFVLWNGSEIYVRTCDTAAKEGLPTRGLTLDGILWVDEAAYVPKNAWEAATLTQITVAEPLTIITSTPCGKNWVYDEFELGRPGPKKSAFSESFRFRTSQSPYSNQQLVRELRAKFGAKRALQELDGVFLGDGGAVFTAEQIEVLLSTPGLARRGSRWTIGLDLAKEVDFLVAVAMNEFGEAWIDWRARKTPWGRAKERVVAMAKALDAVVTVDLQRGGGYGGMMKDFLEDELGESKVIGLQTAIPKVKAQMIETLQSDVEDGKLRLVCGEFAEHAKQELTFFEGHRQILSGGGEVWSYHGPKSEKAGPSATGEGEDHDDIVIALGLANWGRTHGWTKSAGDGGIADFQPRSAASPSPAKAPPRPSIGRPGGGYFLQ